MLNLLLKTNFREPLNLVKDEHSYVAMKFFYSEFLAAGSLNQLPAPLGRNLADA
jgi:hypothetical protein